MCGRDSLTRTWSSGQHPTKETAKLTRVRRPYNSTVRRQQAAETRERILSAGSDLAHHFPGFDWSQGVTFRAVAGRAGVSERTVYRHFPTEQQLHDAVMNRLRDEAAVSFDDLELNDLADITARRFAAMPSYAFWPSLKESPTFSAEHERRSSALRRAVISSTPHWSDAEREMAGAMLDVLWSGASYERLITVWKLDVDRATRATSWVMELLIDAIRNDRRPAAGPDNDDNRDRSTPGAT